VGGVIAMVLAAGVIIWLVTRSSGSSAPPNSPTIASTTTTAETATPFGPVALDQKGLNSSVRSLKQPVFWIGPKAGRSYGLLRQSNGKVFLRYLPPGVKAGDPRNVFLTVGTYPFENAYANEVALSKQSGWSVLKGTSWFAIYRNAKPTSVYLTSKAFPFQIEVYDPSPALARALVKRDRVTPVH
jgi:hypothetical protein